MLSRIHSLGFCLIALALLLFAGSAAAQDVSPRCHAEMDRAAGHYSKCLLSADASYRLNENARKVAIRKKRCGTRFDRRTSRAIGRHGEDQCPSSGLVAALEYRTSSYVKAVKTDEASGTPGTSLLWVQNGAGGTLSDTTLTLKGVSSRTGWFTDRPDRYAGQATTEGFVSNWAEGENSFADDPPNADFTCEVADGRVVNYVVELTSPNMIPAGAGHDLSYSVTAVGDTVLPQTTVTCEADSHLFLDSSGCTGCEIQLAGIDLAAGICGLAVASCVATFGATCLAAAGVCTGLVEALGSVVRALPDCPTCVCKSANFVLIAPLCESAEAVSTSALETLCFVCGYIADKPEGARCEHNNQCHSEQCAWADVSDEHEKCIPCDSEVYFADDYSTCMPKGARCHTDGMCKSGDCDDGWTGLGEGQCK